MQEIIIHNWDELQRAVFDDVWDEKIMRYRDNRIYRGMADESWNLIPSLNRVCGHDWRNIPVSGSFFRLLSIMDCRRVCLTGPIRRSLLRILPRRTQAVMTATA